MKRVQLDECLYEGLLHDFFRVIMRACHMQHGVVEPSRKTLDQLAEGIILARERFSDQFLFRLHSGLLGDHQDQYGGRRQQSEDMVVADSPILVATPLA